MINSPVLIIAFNRVYQTIKVIEKVAEVKPCKLFFFVDGPRPENSSDLIECDRVRKLVRLIDWDCNIQTLFLTDNLGCKYGPVTAINWLFRNEESGIILEDDIIPHSSFFTFCDTMLTEYATRDDVLMISGRNEVGSWKSKQSDYFFSLGGCWGWATWRRAWNLFDPEILLWDDKVKERFKLEYEHISKPLYDELVFGCEAVKNKGLDAWDYQWLFTKMYYRTKDIMPSKNLIKNIGFDDFATHTKKGKDKLKVFSIKIPAIVAGNQDIDYRYINAAYRRQTRHSPIFNLKALLLKIIPNKWKKTLKKLAF